MNRELTDNLDNGSYLPSDVESERAVLALCVKKADVLTDIIGKKIDAKDFSDSRHVAIFEAINSLFLEGVNVDAYTVRERLESDGKLSKAGGSQYVLSLPDLMAVPSNVDEYIRSITEKSRLRQLIGTYSQLQEVARKNGADPNSIIDQTISTMSAFKDVDEEGGFESIAKILHRSLNEIHDIISNKTPDRAVKTGFRGIDYKLGGLKPGTMNVIAARPGVGKTSLVINIAVNVAEYYGVPVDIFSLEMTKTEIGYRIFTTRSNIPSTKLARAQITPEQEAELARAYSHLSPLPIYIDDRAAVTPGKMLAKCKELKAEGKLGLVIVDYLGLMTMGEKYNSGGSRQQEVSDISRSLKLLAKDLQVPVIALSQLSRNAERHDGNPPQLSDLRDSGAIEQDADSVMFIHKKEQTNEEKEGASQNGIQDVYLIVAKNRHGEVGNIRLKWNPSRTLFFEEDRNNDPVEPSSGYTRKTSSENAAASYVIEDSTPAPEPPVPEDIPFDMSDAPNEAPPPPGEEPPVSENEAYFSSFDTEFPEGFGE